ncbi:MAG TPA: 4Fe-4S dicluster domain-containing protein, partial [Candidatus Polarisedimenticolaceae bacterium]|nr:4Fe-4S dicluster domain-containing protein [Candidatus Polarisedimenticolaceae bacterium]
MQLGFVIDHTRCIGCHACTVACKAENDVPLGSFRTWVKYTERGDFPQVRRSFAVLRCNQCTDPPCVTICPVGALGKRRDGIVDIDPQRCIGCKSCLHGCPYDALYINDSTGLAEKCHFCAHRSEIGLAPACAVVCPTEAIVPGDFDDPRSHVARLAAEGGLEVRKPEAGTGPNVRYREVDRAGIDPLETNAAGGFLWAEQLPGARLDAARFEAVERPSAARTTYDVEHPPAWGAAITGYLFAKSIAAGAFLAAIPWLGPSAGGSPAAARPALAAVLLALAALAATGALLIADLKRPERFWFLLRYGNPSSWLVRGTWVLIGYGALLVVWLLLLGTGNVPSAPLGPWLVVATSLLAALTACYTAFLFAQARGRVLWMGRGLWLGLLAHAAIAGGAALIPLAAALGSGLETIAPLRRLLVVGLLVHLSLSLAERAFAPRGREEEYRRAVRLVSHGPFARAHWWIGVGAGVVLPIALLVVPSSPAAWTAASV